MNFNKLQKMTLAVLALIILCIGGATAGRADPWHQSYGQRTVIATPGLSITLSDREFPDRWNQSSRDDRARFCRDVRHECDRDGRRSRACALKWKYCTPSHRDYGYYYNH